MGLTFYFAGAVLALAYLGWTSRMLVVDWASALVTAVIVLLLALAWPLLAVAAVVWVLLTYLDLQHERTTQDATP